MFEKDKLFLREFQQVTGERRFPCSTSLCWEQKGTMCQVVEYPERSNNGLHFYTTITIGGTTYQRIASEKNLPTQHPAHRKFKH